jgi:hypothetical protein
MVARALISICLCALFLSAQSLSAASNPPCAKDFELLAHNLNAAKPIEKYTNPNARGIRLYEEKLGAAFKAQIAQPQKLRWLDVGGGYGVAGLDLASKNPGARVTVINAQDAWKPLRAIDAAENTPYLGQTTLIKMMAQLNIPYQDIVTLSGDRPVFTANWKDIGMAKILAKLKKGEQTKAFDYKPGMAETVLPKIATPQDLITDLYGAYYYSAGRLELLQHYYRLLNKNGRAVVAFKSKDQHFAMPGGWTPHVHGPETNVHTPDGKTTLEEYLVKKYPKIFSIVEIFDVNGPIHGSSVHTLVISRDPSITELNIVDDFEIEKIWHKTESHDSMPDVPHVDLKPRPKI